RTTAAAGSRAHVGAAGTRRRDLRPALAAVAATAAAVAAGRMTDSLTWPDAWTAHIAAPVNDAVGWMTGHLNTGIPVIGGTADWAAHFTTDVLDPIRGGLQGLPWWAALL